MDNFNQEDFIMSDRTTSEEDLAKKMAKSSVKDKDAKVIKTTEFLRYHFTEDEKKDLAQSMAQSIIKARELEEKKKAVTSQFASDINQETAKANSAAQRIESGFEMRTIDCDEHYIYGPNVVRTIRRDSGEEVKERTMTNGELQEEMFGEDEGR